MATLMALPVSTSTTATTFGCPFAGSMRHTMRWEVVSPMQMPEKRKTSLPEAMSTPTIALPPVVCQKATTLSSDENAMGSPPSLSSRTPLTYSFLT